MPNINKIRLSGTTYTVQDENACKVVELTQAEYDALPTTAKTSNSLFVITDAEAGDLSNYYTKTETDGLLDTKLDVSAYTPTDLSNYYTKSETSGATEISTALESKADTATTYTKTETDNAITAATSTKQDTLVSGTNIKTINNQSILGEGNITIQGGSGGGKAIEAGRGISITTGETADTVSFSLPISAGTGENSIVGLDSNTVNSKYSFAFGSGNTLDSASSYIYNFAIGTENSCNGNSNFLFGQKNSLSLNNNFNVLIGYNNRCTSYYNNYNYIFGYNNVIGGVSHDNNILIGKNNIISDNYISYSIILGNNNNAKNNYEVVTGLFNNSLSGSSTVGDSGNTLFSVGNGSSSSARHNAFEIRQNGDIYIADTNDTSTTNYYEKPMIKLQDALGGGGGSSYTAGDGIDITNDVISVTGKVDTSAFTAHTADTVIHVTSDEKAAWNAKSDFSGDYNDLANKPTIPTVPTSNTAFTNDAGYITSSALNGYATTSDVQTATADMATKTWVGQQGYLTEHQSLSNYYTKSETSGATEISTALASKADTATTYTKTETDNAITAATSTKQDTLVSGTNIKTINNQSIIGEGNITIEGGSGGSVDQTIISGSANAVAGGAVYTQLDGLKLKKITQSEYDALSPNYDANTLYVING